MRSIWIPKFGGPQVLEVRETPDPTPARGEVLIRVHACGLNFAEVMARQGLYPDAPPTPMVVGYEAAGEVIAVGEGVTQIQKGKRVAALTRFSGHADLLVVPEDQVFVMPDEMTFEEGAALPVNYLTAYHMLFQVGRVKPGERILAHAVAGGVGTAVCQLCRTVPDLTVYGTASARKHDYARSHGCTEPIDYHTVDYAERVRALTDGRGVDLIFDPLGGPDWKKGYELLRPSGLLIAFGWANMNKGGRRRIGHVLKQLVSLPRFAPTRLMDDNRAIAGVNLGHLWGEIPMLKAHGDALMQLYIEGAIRPHVDKVFSFDQAADAHQYLESGQNVGKIVLVP